MNVTIELINGICLGIEHITVTDDDEEQEDENYVYPRYVIMVNLFILRLMFVKY